MHRITDQGDCIKRKVVNYCFVLLAWEGCEMPAASTVLMALCVHEMH